MWREQWKGKRSKITQGETKAIERLVRENGKEKFGKNKRNKTRKKNIQ